MPSANRSLPTRAEFLDNNLVVLDKCDICHDEFNGTHKPAHIKTSNRQHTCPLCREVLFAKPRVPVFIQESRDECVHESWLHMLSDREQAVIFVRAMWRALWTIHPYDEIYDSDIEEQVNAALNFVAQHYEHESGLFILAGDWPDVKVVAREMISIHFENGEFVACDAEQQTAWIQKIRRAVGWNFGNGKEEEEGEREHTNDEVMGSVDEDWHEIEQLRAQLALYERADRERES